MGAHGTEKDDPPTAPDSPEDVRQVLDSIRRLVSAETTARTGPGGAENVVMLTSDMRVDLPERALHRGEVLAEGLEGPPGRPGAPILDEEALRSVINTIVREELQGELGDRISRNLRKLVRREIVHALEERGDADRPDDA
jgi:hypothetical protein